MYRNLRVRRVLLDYRQENNSYFSLVPLDLINLTVQYLSPDIWKELFSLEKLWTSTLIPDNKRLFPGLKKCFFSDGAIMLGWEGCQPQIITLDGQITPLENLTFPREEKSNRTLGHNLTLPFPTMVFSDLSGGFWYLAPKELTDHFTINYYSRLAGRVVESRSYQLLSSDNWMLANFVMTEDQTCYAIYRGYTDSIYLHTSMLVRYKEATPDLSLHLAHEIYQMEYVDRKLYLSHPHYRFEIVSPDQLMTDSVINPIFNNQEVVWDYVIQGPDAGDLFYLTRGQLSLIKPVPSGIENITLLGMAEDERKICLRITPSGEILILTFNVYEFTLWRLQ